jgi:hypothetical protein
MFSSRPISVLTAVATACLGLVACAAAHPSAANASAHPDTPTCVGLSTCTPPPDADGNPPCYYADGWQADASEGGIAVWYFHEPSNLSKPDEVTAVVRMTDGTVASQIARIDAGQQVHRFGFPGMDKSAVQEVLLSSGGGQCFVTGP